MVLRVFKVAELIDNEIVSVQGRIKQGDFIALMTGLADIGAPGPVWFCDMQIGAGDSLRNFKLDFGNLLSHAEFQSSDAAPHFFRGDAGWVAILFRRRFFMPERSMRPVEFEEAALRAKKLVYDEETEMASIRSAVANMEAAIEFQRSGPKRDPIPEDVKLLVWSRDGGACIRCGAKERLHYDHVIPVAKGGGNTAANIQLLCEPCNLRKSDKIAL